MKFGSLFSGIGGFDLGLERAGMQCAWQVENDPFCNKVLFKHWPNVTRYGDIRKVDWSAVEPIDLLCGGFPCQPHSLAGKRKASSDDRDLWPEFAKAIRELEPEWVLAENVRGLLSSETGQFFGRILSDLASLGYDAEWQVLPAAAFGAPHIRERVWIVAYPKKQYGAIDRYSTPEPGRGGTAISDTQRNRYGEVQHNTWQSEPASNVGNDGSEGVMADSNGCRHQNLLPSPGEGQSITGGSSKNLANASIARGRELPIFEGQSQQETTDFDRRSEILHADGHILEEQGKEQTKGGITKADWWAVEPNVGRVAHGVPSRVDRLRGLGNAVVPQVVEWIGRRIMETDNG